MPSASIWEEAELPTGTTSTGKEEGPDASCNGGPRGQEVPGAASRGEGMPGHHLWYTVCKGAVLPPAPLHPGGGSIHCQELEIQTACRQEEEPPWLTGLLGSGELEGC